MKQLYTLLFLALTLQSAQAQDLRIYDYDWKLTELVIDGQSISFPDTNDEVSAVPLSFFPGNEFTTPQLRTSVCNGGVGDPQFSNTENTFLLDSFATTLIECNLAQNQSFENTYFFGIFSQNTPGIFSYEISFLLDWSNRAMLLLTAPDGSYAWYLGTNLSTRSLNQTAFSVSPNPASDYISIDYKDNTTGNLTIEIYDSLGKRCLAETILDKQPVRVQQLSKGLYFLKVSDGNKTTTQKFIKL